MNHKVLVIAAHPDDEVLGCGGTIARQTATGIDVQILILSRGLGSRCKGGEASDDELEQLKGCTRRALEILGINEFYQANCPDNQFDRLALLRIIHIIEHVIKEVRPAAVYTHAAGDLNIDHALTYRATLAATRPLLGSTIRQVLCYEVPSATDWAFGSLGPVFRANHFADISDTLPLKMQALHAYGSEMREFPHPRSYRAIAAAAHLAGATVGLQAAERFGNRLGSSLKGFD